MGVSTNAILFYGYLWSDEFELIPGSEDDWVEVLAKKRGILNPWNEIPNTSTEEYCRNWADSNRSRLDAWHAAKKEIEAEYAVDLGRHCSDECPEPYIYVKATQIVANRGYPESFEPKNLIFPEKSAELLAKFVKDLEIDLTEAKGPAWWLTSYWG